MRLKNEGQVGGSRQVAVKREGKREEGRRDRTATGNKSQVHVITEGPAATVNKMLIPASVGRYFSASDMSQISSEVYQSHAS